MNFKNLQINKILEYQYSLLILFLVTVSLILNFNINKSIKLVFLVLATVICFFYPSLLIPFGASIYVLYLINSKKRSNEINNIEGFESDLEGNKLLANYLNDSDKNRSELFKNKKKIIEIVLKDTFIDYINNNTVENPSTLKQKYRFIKNLNECYFFDINEDFELIFKLGEEYNSLDDIYKELEFNDNINIEDDNTDERRDNKIELLENETLKKLGLFFYKSKNKNLKLYPDKIIYQLGLSGITNNLFELDDKTENIKYNLLKKNLKELVILFFYEKNKDIDSNKKEFFNFNKIIVLEEYLNIFDIFNTNYFEDLKTNPNLQKINNILNYLNEHILIKNQNLTLFTKLNKEQLKNLSTNNKKELEDSINYLIDTILDNLKNIKLFSINLYKIPDKKEKIRNQYIIHHNLSLIYCLVNSDLHSLLEKIKSNGVLYDYFVKIYDNKKKIFNIQIENEKKIGDDYVFTSVKDVFMDNIFYYYDIKYKDNYFTKIFQKEITKKNEKVDEGATRNEQQGEDIIENPFNYLDEFERTLDKQFSDSEIKEKQEEVLLKYYDLIDKDNYVKVKELNKIAEKRNEELKIKELSFDNVIDNYGNKVYEIIDDIIELINNPKKEFFNNIEAYSEEKTLSLKDIPMILYKLFLILTKDDRILYSGIIFIIVGFFIYFISNETPTNLNYQYQQPSLFQRLL